MHKGCRIRAKIERACRMHRRMTGTADMDHCRHIQLAHHLIERIPVTIAKGFVLPIAARRVGVQIAANELHFTDTAPQLGNAGFDRRLRALRQLAARSTPRNVISKRAQWSNKEPRVPCCFKKGTILSRWIPLARKKQ